MCFRVQGLWFRVQGPGFTVQGSEFRVQESGVRVQTSGFRIRGGGCRVQPHREAISFDITFLLICCEKSIPLQNFQLLWQFATDKRIRWPEVSIWFGLLYHKLHVVVNVQEDNKSSQCKELRMNCKVSKTHKDFVMKQADTK